MPRPRPKTVDDVFQLPIWVYPDSAKGTCKFNGDAKYVTDAGDIILFKASRQVHIVMAIQTAGYTFYPDPLKAIVISDNLVHKGQSGYTPNNFTNFKLTLNNTQLEFDDDNHGNKHFYYTINFIDPNGNPFPFDPIIVNN